MANNNDENDTVAEDLMVSVEFTLVGGTDLDRFDFLLSEFVEESLSLDEEDEFAAMMIAARRLDGKD